MMPLNNASPAFEQRYASHLKHLKLQGLQAKTVDAYARAIRTMGEHFDWQIDTLSEDQLTDYFHQRIASHSWSAVKLDLYGYKFYVVHVLRQPWAMPELIRPPKTSRLPDPHPDRGRRCDTREIPGAAGTRGDAACGPHAGAVENRPAAALRVGAVVAIRRYFTGPHRPDLAAAAGLRPWALGHRRIHKSGGAASDVPTAPSGTTPGRAGAGFADHGKPASDRP